MSRLNRACYGSYIVAEGPAKGTVIERSSNERALPCRRWGAIAGPGAHLCINDGFTLRGLVERIESELARRDAGIPIQIRHADGRVTEVAS